MLIGHTEGNKGLVRIVVKNRKPSEKVITSSPPGHLRTDSKKRFFPPWKEGQIGQIVHIISPESFYIFTCYIASSRPIISIFKVIRKS